MKHLKTFENFKNPNESLIKEGAILSAIKPGLQGEVKTTVMELETYLQSIDVILDSKVAGKLAELVIDIIDAAKDEQRNGPND